MKPTFKENPFPRDEFCVFFSSGWKKTLIRLGALFFLGLAILGGVLEWVSPQPRPLRIPNTGAVKKYLSTTGYLPGHFMPPGFNPYLGSFMEGESYHKKVGAWIVDIHFSRDQTLDITLLDPVDPYPLFENPSRAVNRKRTSDAITLLKTNQELKHLIHLATGGRIPLNEVVSRQETKLKGFEEGKGDLDSWEYTLSPLGYLHFASGKRPLAVGIGY
jgi:hypothetical protein